MRVKTNSNPKTFSLSILFSTVRFILFLKRHLPHSNNLTCCHITSSCKYNAKPCRYSYRCTSGINLAVEKLSAWEMFDVSLDSWLDCNCPVCPCLPPTVSVEGPSSLSLLSLLTNLLAANRFLTSGSGSLEVLRSLDATWEVFSMNIWGYELRSIWACPRI